MSEREASATFDLFALLINADDKQLAAPRQVKIGRAEGPGRAHKSQLVRLWDLSHALANSAKLVVDCRSCWIAAPKILLKTNASKISAEDEQRANPRPCRSFVCVAAAAALLNAQSPARVGPVDMK